MISFKASLITIPDKPAPEILKKDENGKWQPRSVYFVQMDARNKQDTESVGKVAADWAKYCPRGDKTFAADIHRDMYLGSNRDAYSFYALTEQKDNFEILEPEKILGFIQMRPHNEILHEIEYLQSHPSTYYTPEKSIYKHIASTMINNIIDLFPKRNIILMPIESAKKFYYKMGFEQIPYSNKLKLIV